MKNSKTFTRDLRENRNSSATAKAVTALKIGGPIVACVLAISPFVIYEYNQQQAINRAASAFDSEMLYECQDAFPVYNFDGDYVCAPSPYVQEILLTDQPIPKTPEWVKEGMKEINQTPLTQKAKFAGKYQKVKSSLSKEELEYFKALGIGYFKDNQYTEEQQARITGAINYLLNVEQKALQ